MPLRLVRELSPARFAEIGKPAGGWRRDDERVVAFASEIDLLYWPGRAVYEGRRIQYRLSLYDGARENRLGVFDRSNFTINDVAFHPTRPIVAVGTGSYDGGFMFEGDLWLWNWESGEARCLLGERRDVAACRWVDPNRLAVLLRPRDEEEYPGEEDAAFTTYVGLVLDDLRDIRDSGFQPDGSAMDPRLRDLQPIEPSALGFTAPVLHFQDRRPLFDEVMGATAYEERSRVWDVMWLSANLVAATHDGCHVEVWNTRTGERVQHVRGEGFGVQLIKALGSTLLHVLRRANFIEDVDDRSTIYRLRASGVSHLRTFDHALVLSADASGNLLCRDPGDLQRRRRRADLVVDASTRETFSGDLGHYDCFNHFIRLDGQDGLYFLRGTPPSSHEGKRLCRVDVNGAVQEVLAWDDAASHLMQSTACWVSPRSVVRAATVYSPRPGAGTKFIERREFARSAPTWRVGVDAPATDLVSDGRLVVFALTDGTIGVLDAETGDVRWKGLLDVGGVDSFATALAIRGDAVLVGSADGRVLLFEVAPDEGSGARPIPKAGEMPSG